MDAKKREWWLGLKNQSEWKKELQSLLCRSDEAVVSAAKKIWDCQTDTEKMAKMSLSENGVGFNKVDSTFMGQYIEKANQHKLTKEDIAFMRSVMLKYWKQLMRLSKIRLTKEQEQEDAQKRLPLQSCEKKEVGSHSSDYSECDNCSHCNSGHSWDRTSDMVCN